VLADGPSQNWGGLDDVIVLDYQTSAIWLADVRWACDLDKHAHGCTSQKW
jgi:hypothetical protein